MKHASIFFLLSLSPLLLPHSAGGNLCCAIFWQGSRGEIKNLYVARVIVAPTVVARNGSAARGRNPPWTKLANASFYDCFLANYGNGTITLHYFAIYIDNGTITALLCYIVVMEQLLRYFAI